MITSKIMSLGGFISPLKAYQFKAIIIDDNSDAPKGKGSIGSKLLKSSLQVLDTIGQSAISFESISAIKGSIKTKKIPLLGYHHAQKSTLESVEYDDVTFTRALFLGVGNSLSWVMESISEFKQLSGKPKSRSIRRKNIVVLALGQDSIPYYGIVLRKCVPISFELSEFNASENKILLEKVTVSIETAEEYSIEDIGGLALKKLG